MRERRTPLVLTLLAAVLHGWGLAQGQVHHYYAAAVRSMSASLPNAFFGALDPAGSITIDKLPGALWPQVLSVWLFGYHDWALLLPQAIAATLTIPLLYAAVRHWAGPRAALIAALVQLASPVAYAAARVNIPDPILVLCLVAAAYLLIRNRPASAGALVGLGFLVKMLQAWVILPALLAACLADPAQPWRRRLTRAGILGVVAVAISLSWLVITDLIPDRPWIDGGTRNSPWELVFAYNGANRLSAMAVPFAGDPGPLRLLNTQFAGQIGWLLPTLLVCLAGVLFLARDHAPRPGWILWGTWFVLAATAISLSRGGHPYYATLLAPATAALLGTSADALWRRATESTAARWLLALAAATTLATATTIMLRTPPESPTAFLPLALALLCLAERHLRPAGLLAVALAGPATWIALTPAVPPHSLHTANPVAGPQVPEVVFGASTLTPALSMMLGRPPGSPLPPVPTAMYGTSVNPELLDYLRRNDNGARYLLATGEASSASAYLAAGHSVLPMGGFTGSSPYPSVPELAQLIREGQVRHVFLIPMPGLRGPAGERMAWVQGNCAPVPAHPMLFDCRILPR